MNVQHFSDDAGNVQWTRVATKILPFIKNKQFWLTIMFCREKCSKCFSAIWLLGSPQYCSVSKVMTIFVFARRVNFLALNQFPAEQTYRKMYLRSLDFTYRYMTFMQNSTSCSILRYFSFEVEKILSKCIFLSCKFDFKNCTWIFKMNDFPNLFIRRSS